MPHTIMSQLTTPHPANQKVVLEQVVLEKVQQINNDFIVIMTNVDGYDRYGAKTEVECANGWTGWSWELKHAIKAKKKELYDIIINESVINDKGEKITDINDMVNNLIFGSTLPYPIGSFTPKDLYMLF